MFSLILCGIWNLKKKKMNDTSLKQVACLGMGTHGKGRGKEWAKGGKYD
jgi:hypothetical protein